MLWLQSKTKNNKIPIRARKVFLEYHCQYWKYIPTGCNTVVVLQYKDHVWAWSRGDLCDHLTPLTSEPGSKERLSGTKQSPLGQHSGGSPSGSPLPLTWASWASHLASQRRAGEDKVGMSTARAQGLLAYPSDGQRTADTMASSSLLSFYSWATGIQGDEVIFLSHIAQQSELGVLRLLRGLVTLPFCLLCSVAHISVDYKWIFADIYRKQYVFSRNVPNKLLLHSHKSIEHPRSNCRISLAEISGYLIV